MYNAHRGMAPPAGSRLNDLFDQLRQEIDSQTNRSAEYDQQMSSQMQEMEIVRQKVFSLEQAHVATKQRYEDELGRLRHELELRGGPPSTHVSAQSHAPPHPNPPNIGSSGNNGLFGGIMSGHNGPGGPGLPPTAADGQSQGPPSQAVPPPNAPGQPPANFNSYPPPGYNAGANSQNLGSPRNKNQRVAPGPATPQQNPHQGYPNSPHMPRPTPPPPSNRVPDVGNQLAELNPDLLPTHQKREAEDWFAIFNPRIPRTLDVDLVHNLPHDSVVCCVRFSHDGRLVATGCNHSAQIFDVSTGRKIVELKDANVDKPGDLYIRSVCFSPDGKYLATGAEDKLIRVWDIETKTIKHTFHGHEQDIYSLDFSRNGRNIASGSGDRTVRVWDLEMNSEALCLQIEDGVTTVAMSPDGNLVAAGSLDRSVRVWDRRGGVSIDRLEGPDGHKDSVYSVAFAPDGKHLVSGSLDKTIKMWELGDGHGTGRQTSGRCIRTFEGHKDYVLSVALTPDRTWVLSGSKDRGVQFWDPHTGDVQLMLQGHKNSVISVAPSPTGQFFATGSGDTRARIWRYGPWQGNR